MVVTSNGIKAELILAEYAILKILSPPPSPFHCLASVLNEASHTFSFKLVLGLERKEKVKNCCLWLLNLHIGIFFSFFRRSNSTQASSLPT